MPISGVKETVQGTGADAAGSFASGQQIATQQISNAFNYGTEANRIRTQAAELNKLATVSSVINEQGRLDMAREELPSVIASREASTRSSNAQATTIEQRNRVITDDLFREEWQADLEAKKIAPQATKADIEAKRALTEKTQLDNKDTKDQQASRPQDFFKQQQALKDEESASGSALRRAQAATAGSGGTEPKDQASILASEQSALKNFTESNQDEFGQLKPGVSQEDFNKGLQKIKDEYAPLKAGSAPKESPADRLKKKTAGAESTPAPTQTETPAPTQTAAPAAPQEAPSLTDFVDGKLPEIKGYPIAKINKSFSMDNASTQQPGTGDVRDGLREAETRQKIQTAEQARAMVQPSLDYNEEADLMSGMAQKSLSLVSAPSYLARQQRVADISVFEAEKGLAEVDLQLHSTLVDQAKQSRSNSRGVVSLKNEYHKQVVTGRIVDGIQEVVEAAPPSLLADYVQTIPNSKEIRKELGFTHYSNIQNAIGKTSSPLVKETLKKEQAKQASVVFPDAVAKVSSYWESQDFTDPTTVAQVTFGKTIENLDPTEKKNMFDMLSKRSVFQQTVKKLGVGSGKIGDVFSVSASDLDSYPINDPVRIAAARAMERMGKDASDGTFLMKRQGDSYHAAFAPSNDNELSRQASSVTDALFQYRTSLHDGDEADILESAGIDIGALSKLGPKESEILSSTYGLFPYKEALPGMVKAIQGYKEKSLALGDSHELRRQFHTNLADVIMFQTKPGLEYNDPKKRGPILKRAEEITGRSLAPLPTPVDMFGKTALSVSDKIRAARAVPAPTPGAASTVTPAPTNTATPQVGPS